MDWIIIQENSPAGLFHMYCEWLSHPKHHRKLGKDFWNYPRVWWQEPAQISI